MKFPDSTYFNRKLPKQRFYENLTVDQIKSIYWENKISADTINIAAENTVIQLNMSLHYLQVLKIILKRIERRKIYCSK